MLGNFIEQNCLNFSLQVDRLDVNISSSMELQLPMQYVNQMTYTRTLQETFDFLPSRMLVEKKKDNKEYFCQCHSYLIRFHLALTELGVCVTFFKRLNSLVVCLSTALSVVFHFWVMRGKTDSGVFDVLKRFL